MSNEQLYQDALDAVNKLFSDKSVSQSKARENLKSLRDEIDLLIDTLKDDE